jgi:hypothetical protein
MTTPSEDIFKVLVEYGFPVPMIFLNDGEYQLPDEAYIAGLGNRVQKSLYNMDPPMDYKPERGDCDKFALMAWSHAAAEQWVYGTEEAGLAFGRVGLVTMDGGGHMIDGAVHAIAGKLVVKLYEPQMSFPDGTTVVTNKWALICLKEYPRSSVRQLLRVEF